MLYWLGPESLQKHMCLLLLSFSLGTKCKNKTGGKLKNKKPHQWKLFNAPRKPFPVDCNEWLMERILEELANGVITESLAISIREVGQTNISNGFQVIRDHLIILCHAQGPPQTNMKIKQQCPASFPSTPVCPLSSQVLCYPFFPTVRFSLVPVISIRINSLFQTYEFRPVVCDSCVPFYYYLVKIYLWHQIFKLIVSVLRRTMGFTMTFSYRSLFVLC